MRCKKNPDHEYIETKGWYLDEEGNELEYIDCANCIEESRNAYREKIEKANNVDAPELIEDYEKLIRERSPSDDEHKEAKPSYNVIDKYSGKLHEIIGAPEEACRAIVQWDISVALHRLFFADGKGRILPNLGFMWIAPSGADKTPIYNWGVMTMQEKLFSKWKYIHYNRVGGKALISSISKIKPENTGGRILTLITQDEVSTLAKESNSDGLSDVFEAFAQAYDGQLSSSTTVLRQSEVPKPSYSPMWFQGTPVFLKYVNEDFWDIGLGNRIFFVKYQTSEVRSISKTLHAKEFYDEFVADLDKLNKIEKADFSDEAWEIYNQYQMKTMREVQSVQNDLETSVDTDNFDITSKVKYPIQILKMAMIISASRMNYDSAMILHVEKEDVENAIREVEKYHDNMIYIHNIWETQSAQRLKHESIELLTKKILTHMKRLLSVQKAYIIDYDKGIQESIAYPDRDGRWIKHSDLLRQSHMKATGYRSFEEVINTLIEREEIIKRECKVNNPKNKKDKTTSTLSEATFYKLKEN